MALQILGVVSVIALAWSLSGLVALELDDPVSVTSDTRVRRTLVPGSTTSTSSSSSTSTLVEETTSTSTSSVATTTVSVPTTARTPVTVATTTTVAEIQPEPSIEEVCPEGLHPEGEYCVP